jgi:hypothetical protein
MCTDFEITECITERVDGIASMFAISNFPDPAEIHGLHTTTSELLLRSFVDPLTLFSLTLTLPVPQR